MKRRANKIVFTAARKQREEKLIKIKGNQPKKLKTFANEEQQQSACKLSEKGANKQADIEVIKKIKRQADGPWKGN